MRAVRWVGSGVKQPRTLPSWVGATAFVVALFVSVGWAAAMVAAALDDSVSDAGIQLLTGLGGVLAGPVAGFLGAGAALIWQRKVEPDETEGPQ